MGSLEEQQGEGHARAVRWHTVNDAVCTYTEALNNLIKRVKRIGLGFHNFENYRIRALLDAGRPNWRVLGSIVVR